MAPRPIRSYKFEAGNSSRGALGMAIRVWARTKTEATEKANRFLAAIRPLELIEPNYQMGIEYCTVYLSPNLKVRQIAGGGEIEDVSEELTLFLNETAARSLG